MGTAQTGRRDLQPRHLTWSARTGISSLSHMSAEGGAVIHGGRPDTAMARRPPNRLVST